MSWRELIILFRSNARTGELVSNSMIDTIPVDELTDVFHECINNYVCEDHWGARVNSSKLLKSLCFKHRLDLLSILTDCSDGSLMTLSSFNVYSLLADEAKCFYSGKSSLVDESRGSKLYKKKWLRKQREELHRRLGIEVTSSDASAAAKYDESDSAMIDESDLAADCTIVMPEASTSMVDDELTSESWLTRILRYLIVGLLDSQWEVRQGSCMALSGILEGLFPAGGETVSLASYLLEEIVCCCLYLLALDRFIDLSDSSAVCAPVKEMAGQLLSVAIRCLALKNSSSNARDDNISCLTQVSDIVVQLCQSQNHWSTTAGGVIALKELVPLVLERSPPAEKKIPPFLALVSEVFQRETLIDDVVAAATGVLFALQQAVESQTWPLCDTVEAIVVGLEALSSAMGQVSSRLTEYHTCYHHLFKSLLACVSIASSLSRRAGAVDTKAVLRCCECVLQSQQDLLLQVCLYSRDTKLSVLGTISETLSVVQNTLSSCGDAFSEVLASRAFAMLGSLLVVVVSESSAAVGELSLMNEVRHNTASSGKEQAPVDAKPEVTDTTELLKQVGCSLVDLLRRLMSGSQKSSLELTDLRPSLSLFLAGSLSLRLHPLDVPFGIDAAAGDSGSSSINCTAPGVDDSDAAVAAAITVGAAALDGVNDNPEGRRLSKRRKVVATREAWRRELAEEEPVTLFSTAAGVDLQPLHAQEMVEPCLAGYCSDLRVQQWVRESLQAVYVALHRSRMRQAQFHQDVVSSNSNSGKSRDSNCLWSVSDTLTRKDAAILMATLVDCASSVSSVNDQAALTIASRVKAVCEAFCADNLKDAATVDSGVKSASRPKLKLSIVPDTAEFVKVQTVVQTASSSSRVNPSGREAAVVQELEGMVLALLMMKDVPSAVSGTLQQCLQSVISLVSVPVKRRLRLWVLWLRADSQMSSLLEVAVSACGSVAGAEIVAECRHLMAEKIAQLLLLETKKEKVQEVVGALLALLSNEKGDKTFQLSATVWIKVHKSQKEQLFSPGSSLLFDFCSTDHQDLPPDRQLEFLSLLDVLVPDLTPSCSAVLAAFSPVSRILCTVTANLHHTASAASDGSPVIAAAVRVLSALIRLEPPSTCCYLQQCLDFFHTSLFSGGNSALSESTLQEISHFFLSLTESLLDEWLLPLYEQWFSLALQGVGSYCEVLRRPCTAVVRLLVPLAPLARRLHAGLDLRSDNSTTVMCQLFDGGNESQELSEVDRDIALRLSQCTNLTIESKSFKYEASDDGSKNSLWSAAVRPYQWEGVMWLTRLRRCGMGGILADEMGLGKSLEALLTVAALKMEQQLQQERSESSSAVRHRPSLIVCPASLLLHWQQEIVKFFPSDLMTPHIYTSYIESEHLFREFQSQSSSTDCINRNNNPTYSSGSGSSCSGSVVMIVSYDMLRQHVAHFQSLVWEYLILDEAHLIRNPGTSTTQALYSLRSRHRVCLTGTPVQNQVEELWSLMHFLVPDYLGDAKTFRTQWVRPIVKALIDRDALKQQEQDLYRSSNSEVGSVEDSKRDKERKARALDKFHQSVEISVEGMLLLRKLHKQVLPFILRRTKAEVASELPAKTVVDVLCPLSEAQRHLYATFQQGLRMSDDQLEQELRDLKDNGGNGSGTAVSVVSTSVPAVAAKTTSTTKKSSGGGVVLQLDASGFEEEDAEQAELLAAVSGGSSKTAGQKSPLHPFQALTYLKLVSVHPALVVASTHHKYRQRLLSSLRHSGKLLQLARLLVESGVVRRSEFYRDRRGAGESGGCEFSCVEELLESSSAGGSEQKNVKSSDDSDVDSERSCSSDGEGDSDAEEEEHEETEVENKKKRPLAAVGNAADSSSSTSATRRSARVRQQRQKLAVPASKKAGTPGGEKSAPETASSEDSSSSGADCGVHRCLIFAQHKTTLDLVESLVLRPLFPSVGYRRLDGDVIASKRAAIAQEFNAQQPQRHYGNDELLMDREGGGSLRALPKAVQKELMMQKQQQEQQQSVKPAKTKTCDIRILLMTVGSCGLGLNLTAADTVIFVEHDWNPFVDLQAMDRVHRIGQTHPVTVYRLLAESTIEARIVGLQSRKMLVTSEIINQENSGGGNDSGSRSSDGKGVDGRGFGGMIWDSLMIHHKQQQQQQQQGNGENGGHSELNEWMPGERLEVDKFLKSVGCD